MEREYLYLIYIFVIVLATSFISFEIVEEGGWKLGIRGSKTGSMIKQGMEENKTNYSPAFQRHLEAQEYAKKFIRGCDPSKANSFGFKDEEWKKEKDDNTYRIVALGDSFTEGSHLCINDTWPEQLEARLNSQSLSSNFEVMNMGRGGRGTWWEVEKFKEVGLDFNPELVILQYQENDWKSPKVKTRAKKLWKEIQEGEKELPESVKEKASDKNLTKSDMLAESSVLLYSFMTEKYYSNASPKKEWNKWVKGPLEELINITNREDMELVVITWDLGHGNWERNKLEDVLNTHGLKLHDFSEDLPREKPSKWRLPDRHLTPHGYEIVANQTFKRLKDGEEVGG